MAEQIALRHGDIKKRTLKLMEENATKSAHQQIIEVFSPTFTTFGRPIYEPPEENSYDIFIRLDDGKIQPLEKLYNLYRDDLIKLHDDYNPLIVLCDDDNPLKDTKKYTRHYSCIGDLWCSLVVQAENIDNA